MEKGHPFASRADNRGFMDRRSLWPDGWFIFRDLFHNPSIFVIDHSDAMAARPVAGLLRCPLQGNFCVDEVWITIAGEWWLLIHGLIPLFGKWN